MFANKLPPPSEEKTLQEELSLPIILADRVLKSTVEAESNKTECVKLGKQVDMLSKMLRSLVSLATATASSTSTSTHSLYEPPIRRISSDVTKNLERALTLSRKCKHSGVLRQVFSITTTADFRKVTNLLESSIGDLRWLLSIFDSDDTNLSLPPIASNDPILAWVWSYISTIQMGQLKDRIDAATSLGSLACDNDRNKKMIVEEGGILPLLKLLKEGGSDEAQIAAANALFNICTDDERVRAVVDVMGIPIILGVLNDSPMKVQVVVADLVTRMAELDQGAQEVFVRENVTKPLVSLLSMDLVLEVPKEQVATTSIHSIVQMNKELAINKHGYHQYHHSGSNSDGSSRGGHYKKERELELPELKLKVQISCAEALWKLSRGSLSNSKKITETKGLICLAKRIEKDRGDLQFNCLMAIMEITVMAEANSDLRKAAFKTNSLAAKAVLDQLLRVIQEETNPVLTIPAIRSIGCLARTFPAKETRIIAPLVVQLGSGDVDVAIEAANALGKFVCPDNFNCSEHSKAIIEFDGVSPLMRLLRVNDRAQMHGLKLLCYLALNAGNSNALAQVPALNTLQVAARTVVAQHPDLRDLFADAIHQLTLYQSAGHPHRQSFAP